MFGTPSLRLVSGVDLMPLITRPDHVEQFRDFCLRFSMTDDHQLRRMLYKQAIEWALTVYATYKSDDPQESSKHTEALATATWHRAFHRLPSFNFHSRFFQFVELDDGKHLIGFVRYSILTPDLETLCSLFKHDNTPDVEAVRRAIKVDMMNTRINEQQSMFLLLAALEVDCPLLVIQVSSVLTAPITVRFNHGFLFQPLAS